MARTWTIVDFDPELGDELGAYEHDEAEGADDDVVS